MKTRAEGLLENEAGRGAGSAKPLRGQSGREVGGESGETLGQRVVGGASTCQVVGRQEKDDGVRCQRHQ